MATGLQLELRGDSQLDTSVEIVTPENIAFQYRVAGPFRRLPAYLLDCLFRALAILALAIGVGFTFGSLGAGGIAVAIIFVTWFLLSWFYGGLFETFWNGQTPGKYLLHLRVLTVDGEPIAAWQAVLRNILRAADALPLVALPGMDLKASFLPVYMFGFFACLATRRYQRLGDLVAGTMVVVEQRDLLGGVVPVADREVIELAGRLPAACHVDRSLARTLAAYVGRRRYFSAARREEMTRSLGELLAERYQLPPLASYDRLLCALYFRAFIADRASTDPEPAAGTIAQPRAEFAGASLAAAKPPAAGPDLDRWLDELRYDTMKTAFLLESRRENWRALEHLCDELQSRRQRRLTAKSIVRFATLYRAACADLALADAYQLPAGTVLYLHQLVGRAHNQLYRSGRFQLAAWRDTILRDLPRQLFADRTLWLAMVLFWGTFVVTMALAAASPAFVQEVLGDATKQFEENFSHGLGNRGSNVDTLMAGFYIQHNTTIGLQCFAYGLVFGVGGLFVTAVNAGYIGAVFGHMLTTPQRDTFLTFVTAHGPCELTAIVLCSAAGLRLGFSLIRTGGLSREASLRAAGKQALPTIGVAIVLFFAAALIEGFLSPSAAPYWIKAAVAILSAAIIFCYIVVLGFPRSGGHAAG